MSKLSIYAPNTIRHSPSSETIYCVAQSKSCLVEFINQLGNGFQLKFDELKVNTEIEFKWFEQSLTFQIQRFKNKFLHSQSHHFFRM